MSGDLGLGLHFEHAGKGGARSLKSHPESSQIGQQEDS